MQLPSPFAVASLPDKCASREIRLHRLLVDTAPKLIYPIFPLKNIILDNAAQPAPLPSAGRPPRSGPGTGTLTSSRGVPSYLKVST